MFPLYFSVEDREKVVRCVALVSLLLPVMCSFYFFCDILSLQVTNLPPWSGLHLFETEGEGKMC